MIKALRDRIQSSEFCCSATRRDKPFCWGRHNLPAPFSEPRRKPYALKNGSMKINTGLTNQCINIAQLEVSSVPYPILHFFISLSIDTTF